MAPFCSHNLSLSCAVITSTAGLLPTALACSYQEFLADSTATRVLVFETHTLAFYLLGFSTCVAPVGCWAGSGPASLSGARPGAGSGAQILRLSPRAGTVAQPAQSPECPPEARGTLSEDSLSPAEAMGFPLAVSGLHWHLAKGLCLVRDGSLLFRSTEALVSVPFHLGLVCLVFPFEQFFVTTYLGHLLDSVIFPLLQLLVKIALYSRRKNN